MTFLKPNTKELYKNWTKEPRNPNLYILYGFVYLNDYLDDVMDDDDEDVHENVEYDEDWWGGWDWHLWWGWWTLLLMKWYWEVRK